MALQRAISRPRDAKHTVLHTVIREPLEPLLQTVSDQGDGGGLPRFVEPEFRDVLRCGVLAEGFTRLRCAEGAFERRVPFSCHGRGVCPSCGGRRMAERAASLVDAGRPHVPIRQGGLTLPYRLRDRLAWDHAVGRAVLGVSARGRLAFSAGPARARGLRAGQPGTVTAIQRVASGVTVTVHVCVVAVCERGFGLVCPALGSESRSVRGTKSPPHDETPSRKLTSRFIFPPCPAIQAILEPGGPSRARVGAGSRSRVPCPSVTGSEPAHGSLCIRAGEQTPGVRGQSPRLHGALVIPCLTTRHRDKVPARDRAGTRGSARA